MMINYTKNINKYVLNYKVWNELTLQTTIASFSTITIYPVPELLGICQCNDFGGQFILKCKTFSKYETDENLPQEL